MSHPASAFLEHGAFEKGNAGEYPQNHHPMIPSTKSTIDIGSAVIIGASDGTTGNEEAGGDWFSPS